MKCTDKKKNKKKKNKIVKPVIIWLTVFILIIAAIGGFGGYCYYSYVSVPSFSYASLYEAEYHTGADYSEGLAYTGLCVSAADKLRSGIDSQSTLTSAGVFDVTDGQVIYADRIHDRIYPASMTKIMTAYLVLKYGNLDDIVTVSASGVDITEEDAVVCGFREGDRVSVYDLMCGLLLLSGNDSANILAEYISGSVQDFVNLMNGTAFLLMATNTHFVNANGLHSDDHYTTAYDLYLIFSECIKEPEFVKIIDQKEYTATVTRADGTQEEMTFAATNYYKAGEVTPPDGITVIGGKTGTTSEAGNCLILYTQDSDGKEYISIGTGAEDKDILYQTYNQMLSAINEYKAEEGE